jgi:hypothetical protein
MDVDKADNLQPRTIKMKGLKLYALVGTFAVAAVSALPYAFAGEAAPGATGNANLKFHELSKTNTDRGVRLDELFECFKKEQPLTASTAKSTSLARLTPDNPLAHTSLKSNGNKKIAKTMTARSNAKPVTASSHAKPVKKVTPVPKKNIENPIEIEDDSAIVTAKYQQKASSNLVAVSNPAANDNKVITAKLDKPGHLPKYKSGEQMVVKVTANQDCNIIVFDYDSNGTLTQLYPNAYEKSGTLRSGETIEIGGQQSQYTLDVSGKGTERIFVYAYPTTEGQITVAMNPVVNTPFRSAELSVDQYRRLVKESRPYFTEAKPSSERTVSIKAKPGSQVAEASNQQQANKIELTFQVDK